MDDDIWSSDVAGMFETYSSLCIVFGPFRLLVEVAKS